MEYRGEIRDGKVVLDRRAKLADGTVVAVRAVPRKAAAKRAPAAKKRAPKTSLERLAPIIGKAKGLPSDLAKNHDHYLHGQPKK